MMMMVMVLKVVVVVMKLVMMVSIIICTEILKLRTRIMMMGLIIRMCSLMPSGAVVASLSPGEAAAHLCEPFNSPWNT